MGTIMTITVSVNEMLSFIYNGTVLSLKEFQLKVGKPNFTCSPRHLMVRPYSKVLYCLWFQPQSQLDIFSEYVSNTCCSIRS